MIYWRINKSVANEWKQRYEITLCVCVVFFYFIWKINAYYIDMFQVMHLWLTQMEGQNRLKQRKQTPTN